ncbi:DUF4435 domain-containing protein [Bacillus thuringiensis]|uniref:DUF4435 domain-containing protein n=1 Tax=Bacillus thuringiensis subsp. jegathesan TaxID=56955 RepID=A0A9X6R0L2_BACTJ|nr:DUF4435 domain-containing protein [Bacillus thuringiensis]OUB69900.1 hypothetical protein BK750_13050 [Bacillus thuringiensis serovar jegathesan]
MEKNLSRDDKLRNKRTRGTVGYTKFALKYKSEQKKPYCFVEGEDDKYYLSKLIMICKTEPEFIRCNGKQGVIETFQEIQKHKEYEEVSLLFFVDSDFDTPINNDNIYETPCYSIENLYTSPRVFARILKSEFGLDETEKDFTNAMDFFINRQNEFHDAISLLNAWILSYKKYIDKTGEVIKLRLNDLSFKEQLIEISFEGITCKYTLEAIEKALNVQPKISNDEIMSNYQEISSNPNRGEIFRGKFELEFFRILLNKLVEDRNKKANRKIFLNKKKISLPLDTNILTVLSSYAEIPDCLFEYIERRWKTPQAPVASTVSTA